MRNLIKAAVATPFGVAGLGLAYTMARSEIHYWTSPAHLPLLLTGCGVAASLGIGGASVWGKGKLEARKERKATEELADIREQLKAKEALPEGQPTVIDLGHVRDYSRRQA